MLCENVINVLREQYPEQLACEWDNVGLLIGDKKKEIKKIYVALDATDEVVKKATDADCDMLLTHHPMIFTGIKKITMDDFVGRRIIKLVQKDMAYYAMHTNFDVMGMADLAADKMNLKDTLVLQETGKKEENIIGIGKVGVLPNKMTLKSCGELVKKAFALDTVRLYGDLSKEISNVAICPGSGKGMSKESLREKVQVLITGDLDYHECIDAVARDLCVIDAGHYGLEQIFIPYMQEYLTNKLPEIHTIAHSGNQPFVTI